MSTWTAASPRFSVLTFPPMAAKMVINEPNRMKTKMAQNMRPLQMVKSILVWKEKAVRAMTTDAVAAAATSTISPLMNIRTSPKSKDCATVKTASMMKLMGTTTRRVLEQAMAKMMTKPVAAEPTRTTQNAVPSLSGPRNRF